MEAFPKSSGATSQVVMGTETKPISAETPGPMENDMNLFRKSRGDSRKQIPPGGVFLESFVSQELQAVQILVKTCSYILCNLAATDSAPNLSWQSRAISSGK